MQKDKLILFPNRSDTYTVKLSDQSRFEVLRVRYPEVLERFKDILRAEEEITLQIGTGDQGEDDKQTSLGIG